MDEVAKETPTLLNSLETLNQRNYELVDLVALSERLLEKFLNPRNKPIENIPQELATKEAQPGTLVDEFYDVSNRLKAHSDIIGRNLERVIVMIE